jgi:hypothetical protein
MAKLILLVGVALVSAGCVVNYNGKTYDCDVQQVNGQWQAACEQMVTVSRP